MLTNVRLMQVLNNANSHFSQLSTGILYGKQGNKSLEL